MELHELRPELLEILREQPDRWWPSYSLWFRLQERFPEQASLLSNEYEGRIGDGGGGPGGNYGMVSHISHSLNQVPEQVEKAFLHTKGLRFRNVRASDTVVAMFRLRQDS